MDTSKQTLVMQLLDDVRAGDQAALDQLFSLTYEELRALAHQQRRQWRGDYTLNTTALVHEAYVKLVNQKQVHIEGRAHFLALASRAMRHILSNYARRQRRQKRGGGQVKVSLEDLNGRLEGQVVMTPEQADVFLALDEALNRLEQTDERQSRVVECRFFGRMTIQDTALALNISSATVKRDWTLAQAWLYRELKG